MIYFLNIKVFIYRIYNQVRLYGLKGFIINPFGICILRAKSTNSDINDPANKFLKKNMENYMKSQSYSFSQLNWSTRHLPDGTYEHRLLNASLKKHKDIYK